MFSRADRKQRHGTQIGDCTNKRTAFLVRTFEENIQILMCEAELVNTVI